MFTSLLSYFKPNSQFSTDSQFASKYKVENTQPYARVDVNERYYWELFKVHPIPGKNEKIELLKNIDSLTLFVLRLDGKRNTFSGEDSDPELDHSEDSLRQYVRSYIHRLKTIKHPSILQLIDVFEFKSKYYIVTEFCNPLLSEVKNLATSLYFDSILSWGLHQIVDVLYFLHKKGMYHNYVNAESVFIVKSGDWKLGNLAFLTQKKETDTHVDSTNVSQNAKQNQVVEASLNIVDILNSSGKDRLRLLDKYIAPEFLNRDPHLEEFPDKIDSWGMAILIFETYLGALGISFTNRSQIEKISNTTISKLPHKLQSGLKSFVKISLKERGDISSFFKSSYFLNNDYIDSLLFIQELSLKDQAEIDRFMEDFADRLEERKSKFPQDCIKYRILPSLLNSVMYGNVSKSTVKSLFSIGSQLSEEEYKSIFVPQIIDLFSLEDHIIQLNMLQNIVQIVSNIESDEVVEYQLFRNRLEKWFQSPISKVREMSVKALIPIIPRLSEACVDNIVIGILWILLGDTEGSIRTNTIIVIGKVVEYLSDASKDKLLLPSIARLLKDPFRYCRQHALQVLCDTLDTYQPAIISTKIIPLISSRMIDPSPEIRKLTIETLEALISKMKRLNDEDKLVQKKEEDKQEEIDSSGTFNWAFSSVKKVLKVQNEKSNNSVSSNKFGTLDSDSISNRSSKKEDQKLNKETVISSLNSTTSTTTNNNNLSKKNDDITLKPLTSKLSKVEIKPIQKKSVPKKIDIDWETEEGWEELSFPTTSTSKTTKTTIGNTKVSQQESSININEVKKVSNNFNDSKLSKEVSKPKSFDDPFDDEDGFNTSGWEISIPTIPVMKPTTRKKTQNNNWE